MTEDDMTTPQQPLRRQLREQRGRRRRRARKRALVVTTLTLAAATLFGVGAVGGTYALLSASAPSPGAARITADGTDLGVGNGTTTGSTMALGSFSALPTVPAVVPVLVSSTSAVPQRVTAQVAVTSSSAITANTRMKITPVVSSAACVAGLSGTASPITDTTARAFTFSDGSDAVTATQPRWLCVEVSLVTTTPIAQAGQQTGFTITFTGTQKVQ